MLKHEAKKKRFGAVVINLYRACQDGDRAAADAALRELSGLMGVSAEELLPALRWWISLPPSECELRESIEENRRIAEAAAVADLVF